jgi:hypothetical protein
MLLKWTTGRPLRDRSLTYSDYSTPAAYWKMDDRSQPLLGDRSYSPNILPVGPQSIRTTGPTALNPERPLKSSSLLPVLPSRNLRNVPKNLRVLTRFPPLIQVTRRSRRCSPVGLELFLLSFISRYHLRGCFL